ncbi:MAG: hypothetical protein IPM24_03915 [Bryobacterales bacterium]|nr:hypothetical protein [Bryobacterales bacterium]
MKLTAFLVFLWLLLLTVPGVLSAKGQKVQAELGDMYQPLVIVGEGWSQQIIVKNVDREGDALVGTLDFFTANGAPWEVELVGRARASRYFITLNPGQVAVFETVVKDHGQVLGFARTDVACCAWYGAQTIFRKQTEGRPDLMASVSLDDKAFRVAHIPFDNIDGKYTGLGVLNTRSCLRECTPNDRGAFRYTFRDEAGVPFETRDVAQQNFTLSWVNLGAEFPSTNGRRGSLEISAVNPEDRILLDVAAFSLQFTPNGAFAAIVPIHD